MQLINTLMSVLGIMGISHIILTIVLIRNADKKQPVFLDLLGEQLFEEYSERKIKNA